MNILCAGYGPHDLDRWPGRVLIMDADDDPHSRQPPELRCGHFIRKPRSTLSPAPVIRPRSWTPRRTRK